jgi:hypothetical protein
MLGDIDEKVPNVRKYTVRGGWCILSGILQGGAEC